MIEGIRRSISLQAEALSRLADNCPVVCEEVIHEILSLRGRVVFTGMGKSGIIAKKVAATMASTGTPAMFVHPAESLHGDLGMITRDDLVFFISKSGENPELRLMLPTFRHLGVKMVALTSAPKSSLANSSDWVIDLGKIDEICPLSIAPTTSTTLCLVLVDAMAMELMKLRKFEEKDYALFHPGGELGRKLNFLAQDMMISGEDMPVISADANCACILETMTRGHLGAVMVCDHMHFQGLVTDYDIRAFLQKGGDIHAMKARDLMNANPISIKPSESAYEALLVMRKRKVPITLLPVVNDQGSLCGILTLETMVQHGLV